MGLFREISIGQKRKVDVIGEILLVECLDIKLLLFTPLEIMPHCSAAGLDFTIIPVEFNAPLEFLTGFT